VFLAIVLSIWTLMHVYVVWRAASVPLIARLQPRWPIVAALLLLYSSYVLARFAGRTPMRALAGPLEVIGATWIGVLFLALTCFLILDVVTACGWVFPAAAPRLRGWALVAAGLLSAGALVQGLRPPVVNAFEIELKGLPSNLDRTVLVFVSDLHLGTMIGEGWLRARIAQVEALGPDIVVVGGDVFEGDSDRERGLLPVLRQMKARLGVYAVNGNHDGYGRGPGGMSLLEEAGFTVLDNRWSLAAPGLAVAGVDDLGFRRGLNTDAKAVERALAGRPPGIGTVFVTHVPAGAEPAARAGAGLMLAGHTHAGQIWPFSIIVRLATPLFAGRYDVDGMPVIVCRGTGTFGPRMRLWRPGEILRISLRSPARTP
jgi:predicted MPP superfamily phosphohydrolase